MEKKGQIFESQLYEYWQNFCLKCSQLKNPKLRGIYAGKLNLHEGPDFQGAEIEFENKIYRGDIEIHRYTNDWFVHGHHLDNRYNRVVLHLVWEKNVKPVYNSERQPIETISMYKMSKPPPSNEKIQHCLLSRENNLKINEAITELAYNRVLIKAREVQNIMNEVGIDQGLYQLLLRTLGYLRNVTSFERLAKIIPWSYIQTLKMKSIPSLEYWLALYLGGAGFIGSEQNNITLINLWQKIKPTIPGIEIDKNSWRLGGTRPNNNPKIRLAGMANFVHMLKDISLYQLLSELFYQRMPYNLLVDEIIWNFAPTPPLSLKKIFPANIKFWGRSLIIEMIGNIFIPFFLNHSEKQKCDGFTVYLRELYLSLPAGSDYGLLKPFKIWRNIQSSTKRYFYYNQGLLSLKSQYCLLNLCNNCPLKRFPQKY